MLRGKHITKIIAAVVVSVITLTQLTGCGTSATASPSQTVSAEAGSGAETGTGAETGSGAEQDQLDKI